MDVQTGIPPKFVTTLLRIDGAAVGIGAIAAYAIIGGNWWLFALLILAPDLSMFGLVAGEKTGAKVYDLAHSYVWPILLGAVGYASGIVWMLPVALVWAAHIGIDRAIGYGLKYPFDMQQTHLGVMGKRKGAKSLANPG